MFLVNSHKIFCRVLVRDILGRVDMLVVVFGVLYEVVNIYFYIVVNNLVNYMLWW